MQETYVLKMCIAYKIELQVSFLNMILDFSEQAHGKLPKGLGTKVCENYGLTNNVAEQEEDPQGVASVAEQLFVED